MRDNDASSQRAIVDLGGLILFDLPSLAFGQFAFANELHKDLLKIKPL